MRYNHTLAGRLLALTLIVSLFLLSSARATVTVVSDWRMGENDPGAVSGHVGTSSADLVGGRTMTLLSAPFYSSSVATTAAGHVRSTLCLEFFLNTCGTNALIPSLTDNFGLELWVNSSGTSGNQCLAYNGDTSHNGWGLYQVGANYECLFGGVIFFGAAPISTGTWTHLALVRNNGTATFYVNGVASVSTNSAPLTPSGLFGVAADPVNVSADQFAGYLDEVRVFTFAAGAFNTNDLLINAQLPGVTTTAATSVSATGATLNASVNPSNAVTAAWFQYGTDTSYGSFGATNTVASNNVASVVSSAISGLSLATLYHFRAVANNNAGTVNGPDLTFTTAAIAPVVTTLAATSVSTANAALNGTVNPGGGVTLAWFQYGTTTGYGSFTATNTLAAVNTTLTVTNLPGGLLPGTLYHFQLVATNSSGTALGADLTFTTPVTAPTVVTLAATTVSATNAALNGTVNPGGGVTLAWFQYGTTTGYGSFTATNTLAAVNTTLTVTNLPGGLLPGTLYHFQLVATNSAGTALGADLTFTTPVTAPTVVTLAATTVSATNATLNGTVNPGGGATMAWFQYGTTTAYGSFTGTNTLAAVNTTLTVTNLPGGLLPATLYHFQLVATNSAGTALGSDLTFTTPVAGPTVVTLAATTVSATNATLNGTVNPGEGATMAWFQYGTTTAYGSFTGTNTLAAVNTTLTVTNLLSGLLSGTLYHFQLVATNSAGKALGSDLTFTTAAAAPVATTLAATTVGATNATLNGTVNPDGGVTLAWFQYGTTTAYGNFTTTNILAATNATLTVTNLSGGLLPATLYHFQLVATNSAGAALGADLTFTTPVAAPAVVTLAATSVSTTNATLNATVNPNGAATAVWFQYGTGSNFTGSALISNPSFEANSYPNGSGYASQNGNVITGWTISNPAAIGLNYVGKNAFADNGAIPDGTNVAFIQSAGVTNTLSTVISNLIVGQSYTISFRANCRAYTTAPTVAWSVNGGSFVPFMASPAVGGTNAYYTNAMTFMATSNSAPLVLQNTSPSDATVLLDAFIISNQGTSAAYLTGNTTVPVAVGVGGLQPGTVYYFQALATNSAGSGTGGIQSFLTPPAAPYVTTLAATSVGGTNATLNGTVNPDGSATLAWFQYGTDTSYGSFTATNSFAGASLPFAMAGLLGGLTQNTLYHYQLVAVNSAGTVYSPDATFTSARVVPVTANVTSTMDGGAGSLRAAIASSISGDTIVFDPSLSGSSIVLTGGQFLLTNNLVIDASALAGGLALNGNQVSRLFQVAANATVTLTALTLTNGLGSGGSGGGIYNSGTLTLNRCTLAGNTVRGTTGGNGANGSDGNGGNGGNGGLAAGGALYNDNAGQLTVNECTLTANTATGGNGGNGGSGGSDGFGDGYNGGGGGTGGTGSGGAIYNAGALGVNQCTIAANTTAGGNGGAGGAAGGRFSGSGSQGGTGAADGAAIYQAGTLALFNSIAAGNSPDNVNGTITTNISNLTSGNPLLSALGNNGGPTPTLLLQPGSPAFDAGAATTFTTDQRGFARVLGSAPDLGAVEMPAPIPVTLAATDLGGTNATLNGTIDDAGVATTAWFQYGLTTNYGMATATNSLVATNTIFSLTNLIGGLAPGTLYHYRIAATGIGTEYGLDMTFVTPVTAPTVTTLAATGITTTQGTLNGTVNPNGLATLAWFQYGTDTTYGSYSATNLLVTTNNTLLGVSNVLSGLPPGTMYHYQLVAANSAGITAGADVVFTTAIFSPVVATLPATGIGGTNVTLNGTVNPGGGATTAYFQYGTSPNFPGLAGIPDPGFEANSFAAGVGYASQNGGVIKGWTFSSPIWVGINTANGPFADNGAIPEGTNVAFIQANGLTVSLSTVITNLLPGAAYQVSFRANCRSGNSPNTVWSLNGGSLLPFTASPSVGGTNGYYTNTMIFTATATTAALYLQNSSSGDTTALVDDFTISSISALTTIPAGTNEVVAVPGAIGGLLPDTTYYFQFAAVNSAGSASGATQTFTTAPAAPSVNTLAASGIGAGSATLAGSVNASGLATLAWFQYGPDTNYGSFSATNTLGATNTYLAVSNLVSGLLPGTVYHFQMVAANSAGTTPGSDLTFTTTVGLPTVVTTTAVPTVNGATLMSLVNPGGGITAALFLYGSTSNLVTPAAIFNGSFELNSFGGGLGYASQNGGVISGWTLSSTNAIGINTAAGPLVNNGAIPDGVNAAFIEANNATNTLATVISNLVAGEVYQVSFRANCRSGSGTPAASWSLNRGALVPFTATPAVGGTNAWYTNTLSFTATSNTAPLVLQNASTTDSTVLVDAFTILDPAATTLVSPASIVPAGTTSVPVATAVSGLQPATTYYFQALANNSAGGATGTVQTFTTLPSPPLVVTLTATSLAATNATLNASVNPYNLATAAWFQYGLDTNYGSFSATNYLAVTNTAFPVSSFISGLVPNTLYHFRAVAANSAGSAPGADLTFMTANAMPGISALSATVIATNAANGFRTVQFAALINPNGGDAMVSLAYGQTTAYAATLSPVIVPATIPATNLLLTAQFSAGSTYHWQVTATNIYGSTVSADQTFTLGTLGGGGGLSGDLNGDGIVSGSELATVYSNYLATSPWLALTNVTGLGGTNVTFTLAASNSVVGGFSVQYSTDLVNWFTLGAANPLYQFTDTNAPAQPLRYYRLTYP